MDFILYLDGQSLQEIMRSIIIPLGWTYIALWSLDHQPPELTCKDGWFNVPQMETGSFTAQSVGQTLFNLYKLCRFALDAGVPGLALNRPQYVWLTANELLCFSSNQSQEEFYKAAGIQVSVYAALARFRNETAVFIPCGNGVIELGTTNLVQANEQNNLRIASLLASVIASHKISFPVPGTTISTSSCTSLLSRSIKSSEGSSMVSYLQYPTISTEDQINIPADTQQYSMSASELASGFYPDLQTLPLPSSYGLFTSGHDHETTLAVYPGSSQQISVPDLLFFPQMSQASGFPVSPSKSNIMPSAFGMWRTPSKVPTLLVVEGQYRLKRCLAILRNIHVERLRQMSLSGSYRPPGGTISSGQVHHTISERRRREKIKESFEALRSFFSGGSRKDKVSILAYTMEYLTSLKSRAEELEERNKQLESELKNLPRAQSQEDAGTGTSTALQLQGSTSTKGNDNVVTVEVWKMAGDSMTATTCNEMGIAVVVDSPTNTIDLVIAVLKRLREMGVPFISMATSSAHHEHDPSRLQFRMTATIKLQDDEVEWVKEELVNAVRKHGGPPPPS